MNEPNQAIVVAAKSDTEEPTLVRPDYGAKDVAERFRWLAVNPDDNPKARRLYERRGYRHDGGTKYLDGVYGDYEDWVIDLE